MLRDDSAGRDMFIGLRELTNAGCQSMAIIAIYVNLYTIYTFGHHIRAPHYFQTLGWIGFIYGLMIGTGPKLFSVPSPPLPMA